MPPADSSVGFPELPGSPAPEAQPVRRPQVLREDVEQYFSLRDLGRPRPPFLEGKWREYEPLADRIKQDYPLEFVSHVSMPSHFWSALLKEAYESERLERERAVLFLGSVPDASHAVVTGVMTHDELVRAFGVQSFEQNIYFACLSWQFPRACAQVGSSDAPLLLVHTHPGHQAIPSYPDMQPVTYTGLLQGVMSSDRSSFSCWRKNSHPFSLEILPNGTAGALYASQSIKLFEQANKTYSRSAFKYK